MPEFSRERKEGTRFEKRSGYITGEINRNAFSYEVSLSPDRAKDTVYHLTKEYLGEECVLVPSKVPDGDIDFDQIPYEEWDDAPYRPGTPRIDTVVVGFAPSPEQALLAIGAYKAKELKEQRFEVYGVSKSKIPNVFSPQPYNVRDACETGEIRTEENVPVKHLGFITFSSVDREEALKNRP